MIRGKSLDPSKTALIRNKAVRQSGEKYKMFSFRLKALFTVEGTNPMTWPITVEGKIATFEEWMNSTVYEVFFRVNWTDRLIEDAYRKGMTRGIMISSPDILIGDSDFNEGLLAGYSRTLLVPEHLDFLKSKVTKDIKSVLATMAGQMTALLSVALLSGKDPVKELLDRVDKIGVTRSSLVLRSEIVRAQSVGLLDSMRQLGHKEVIVNAELESVPTNNANSGVIYLTAGDYRVCPLCSRFDGMVMDIEDAYGLIPVHPGCRCSFIPTNRVAKKRAQPRFEEIQ